MLETVLKHWDSRGSLECNVPLNFSRPVYTVQTGGEWPEIWAGSTEGFVSAVYQQPAVCLLLCRDGLLWSAQCCPRRGPEVDSGPQPGNQQPFWAPRYRQRYLIHQYVYSRYHIGHLMRFVMLGNIKDKEEDWDSHWSSKSSVFGTSDMQPGGVLNPTACLHPGDILLFTVTQQHYPQYDV